MAATQRTQDVASLLAERKGRGGVKVKLRVRVRILNHLLAAFDNHFIPANRCYNLDYKA